MRTVSFIAALLTVLSGTVAQAQLDAPPVTTDRASGGKLLATGGLSQFEGAGGGGLTPWALISGYGTNTQIGGNGHFTHINTSDVHLNAFGASMGLYDLVEFSVTQMKFDTEQLGAALGLGRGFTFTQDVIGLKVKVAGNAVLDQDTLLPQIAVGAMYKRNNRSAVLNSLGITHDDGVDFYLSATKVLLAQSLILNGTLRFTKANQAGILGFGDDYRPMLEGSVGYLLSRHWVIGGEYRMKPDRLIFAKENDWYDGFIAWFPNKHLSVTAAYVRLGNIVIRDNQDAAYLSVQIGF